MTPSCAGPAAASRSHPLRSLSTAITRRRARKRKQISWTSSHGGAQLSSSASTSPRAVVSGRLQIRNWQDKEGNKRRSAEVVADNVYFGDSKRDSADGGFNQSQGYAQSFNQIPQPQQPAYQAPQNVSAASSDFSMLSDDDPELPF